MHPVYFLSKGVNQHTPSDTTEITAPYRHGFWVEGAGDVKVEYEDGTTHTWPGLNKFDTIYGSITKIYATGTTVDSSKIFTFQLRL